MDWCAVRHCGYPINLYSNVLNAWRSSSLMISQTLICLHLSSPHGIYPHLKERFLSNYVDIVLQFSCDWLLSGDEDIMLTLFWQNSLCRCFPSKWPLLLSICVTFFFRKENSSCDLLQPPHSTHSWFLRVVLVLHHPLPCRWPGGLLSGQSDSSWKYKALCVCEREDTIFFICSRHLSTFFHVFCLFYISWIKQFGLEKSV